MKKALVGALAIAAGSVAANADLIITGVLDGPLSGGVPKAIELYATADIPDLSIYGFGSANNGGGSDGDEFTLSGSATAGDFFYVATTDSVASLTADFGIPSGSILTTGAAAVNGDDAIELFQNGVVIDTFGDINVDGNGESWEYLDSWASRNASTVAGGAVFTLADWTFGGANALDGLTGSALVAAVPFGTFSTDGSEPTGACCDGIDTCLGENLTATECANLNGAFGGPNSMCGVNDFCVAPPVTMPNANYPNLVITEVVDATLSGGNPKFVEITNFGVSDFTFTSGGVIRQGNADTGVDPASVDVDLAGVTLRAGQSFTIQSTSGGGDAIFTDTYGYPANLFTPAFFSNGDDRYILVVNGEVVDIHGEVDTDGTGTPWEYLDSYAFRNDGVTTNNNGVFDINEWTHAGPNALGGADAAGIAAVTTPGFVTGGDLTGACCAGVGNCTVVLQENCTTGIFNGPGTRCTDANLICEDFSGACCVGLVCFDGLIDEDCSGVFNGVGSTCDAVTCSAGDVNAAAQQLTITEIVDGTLPGALPRFVEITNNGNTPFTFGAGDGVIIQSNSSSDLNIDVDLFNPANSFDPINDGTPVTIGAGQSYVIANNSGTGNDGQVAFNAVYGFDADLYDSSGFSNGDDRYILFVGGHIIDIYGEINTDGSGTPWEYTDSYAFRLPSVTSGNLGLFDIAEWFVGAVAAFDGAAEGDIAAVTTPGSIDGNTVIGACCDGVVCTDTLEQQCDPANFDANNLCADLGVNPCGVGAAGVCVTLPAGSHEPAFVLGNEIDCVAADQYFFAGAQLTDFTVETSCYDWEDVPANPVLGFSGTLTPSAVNVATPAGSPNAGVNSVQLSGDFDAAPAGATLGAYDNLLTGDLVSMSVWTFDETPDSSPSVTLASHFATQDFNGNTVLDVNLSFPDPSNPGQQIDYNSAIPGNSGFNAENGWGKVGMVVAMDNGTPEQLDSAYLQTGIVARAEMFIGDGLTPLIIDDLCMTVVSLNDGSSVSFQDTFGFTAGIISGAPMPILPGTPADVTGACCINDVCSVLTLGDCVELNDGFYQGNGTVCEAETCGPAPVDGACCVDGTCVPTVTTEAGCLAIDGEFTPGVTCGDNPCQVACPADTDGNGVVNGLDFNAVLTAFGTSTGDAGFDSAADTDGNGAINGLDFNAILTAFGTACP